MFWVGLPVASLRATDELAIQECQRRSNQPCTKADFGPYTGIFVVDTGFSCSVAFGSARFQKSPDASWRFTSTNGLFLVGTATTTIIENIAVGGLEQRAERSRLLLLEKPERSPGLLGIDGILGLPEMRKSTLRINLEKQLVESLNPPVYQDDRATKITLQPGSGVDLRVPLTIGSAGEVRAIVDTGCRHCLLLRSTELSDLDRLGIAVQANKVTISTPTEIREVQTWILKSVTVCGFEFLDVPVLESNFNAIGMGCFSHFDMVLDFPKNEMWLTPHSNDWPKRVPPDASGLVLGFLDTNVLKLLRMQPDSAAAKSELQIDDQILLFDGKEPKDISMWEIQQRVTKAGTKLPLLIRRGDLKLDVELPLSYSFEYPPKWSDKKNVLNGFEEFLEQEKATPDSAPADQPK